MDQKRGESIKIVKNPNARGVDCEKILQKVASILLAEVFQCFDDGFHFALITDGGRPKYQFVLKDNKGIPFVNFGGETEDECASDLLKQIGKKFRMVPVKNYSNQGQNSYS